MSMPADPRHCGDGRVRHRCVPSRSFGAGLIVARPSDGAAVVMEPTAAIVWRQLDDWTTRDEIDRRLAVTFPTIPAEDRVAARTEILETLQGDDLVERR